MTQRPTEGPGIRPGEGSPADDRQRLRSILDRYGAAVEAEMRDVVGSSPLPLFEMMRYHLGWVDVSFSPVPEAGGKKLRPTLCLLVCEAVGGNWERAVPAAAAIELLHNFSLIHDDIEDDSRERRHRPTVWSIWGRAQAINVGDAMHILAQKALGRLPRRSVGPALVLEAARVFGEASLLLTEGQYLDMSFEGRLDVDVAEYLRMIDQKTAALIACSTRLGALLGGAGEPEIEAYRRFGEKLGLAFQIRDDFLGIWGDEAETGKSAASDILTRKKSLPVIYGLQHATGEDGRRLLSYYKSPEPAPAAVPEVVAILEGTGAAGAAEEMADRLRAEALAQIAGFDGKQPACVDDLRFLSQFLVRRTS